MVHDGQVLEHVARVNGKLDVLGLDFSGQAFGEGRALRLRASGLPPHGSTVEKGNELSLARAHANTRFLRTGTIGS